MKREQILRRNQRLDPGWFVARRAYCVGEPKIFLCVRPCVRSFVSSFVTLPFGPRKRRYEGRMAQKEGPSATFGSRFEIDLGQRVITEILR